MDDENNTYSIILYIILLSILEKLELEFQDYSGLGFLEGWKDGKEKPGRDRTWHFWPGLAHLLTPEKL